MSAQPHNEGHRAMPRISDAEWTVMKVFWERGTSTLSDVVRELEGRLHWKPRTVQSLIRRLSEKGALAVEVAGREFRYTPAVDQSHCQLKESRTFLERVFNGRLTPFVTGLMEREEVSKDDLAALREVLAQAEHRTKSSLIDSNRTRPNPPMR
ncbi:MAG: BlaI/MecI/CopY family transcriptional regulator [Prosthecobacter sp.]